MKMKVVAAVLAISASVYGADANSRFVERAYEDLLGRNPNRFEMNAWLNFANTGGSRAIIAISVMGSAEYKGKLVDGWFNQYLGRGAMAGGRTLYVQTMLGGKTDKEVRGMLVGSEEYFDKVGRSETGFIRQMYADLLGRAPSASEEHGLIGLLRGSPRMNVVLAVEDAAEFDGREVQGIYETFLGRGATLAELNWGVNVMRGGAPEEAVIAPVMGSAEYAK